MLFVICQGDPYDIMLLHGIGHNTLSDCHWSVAEAIQCCHVLDIKWPYTFEKQFRVVEGFKQKSIAVFDACVGALDSILVWIKKLSNKECTAKKIGLGEFA